jgi:hypothetical protein
MNEDPHPFLRRFFIMKFRYVPSPPLLFFFVVVILSCLPLSFLPDILYTATHTEHWLGTMPIPIASLIIPEWFICRTTKVIFIHHQFSNVALKTSLSLPSLSLLLVIRNCIDFYILDKPILIIEPQISCPYLFPLPIIARRRSFRR